MNSIVPPEWRSRQTAQLPSPAGSAATEDEGQRYLEGMSASEMSDKYPAGLNPSDNQSTPPRRAYTIDSMVHERRRVSVDVRFSEAEREAIRARARRLGIKPSTWARATLLDALDTRRNYVPQIEQLAEAAPHPDLADAVTQVRRVGVNLNQALRKGTAVDEQMLRRVLRAVDEVRALLGDRTRL